LHILVAGFRCRKMGTPRSWRDGRHKAEAGEGRPGSSHAVPTAGPSKGGHCLLGWGALLAHPSRFRRTGPRRSLAIHSITMVRVRRGYLRAPTAFGLSRGQSSSASAMRRDPHKALQSRCLRTATRPLSAAEAGPPGSIRRTASRASGPALWVALVPRAALPDAASWQLRYLPRCIPSRSQQRVYPCLSPVPRGGVLRT
jgi:hypothetical protein